MADALLSDNGVSSGELTEFSRLVLGTVSTWELIAESANCGGKDNGPSCGGGEVGSFAVSFLPVLTTLWTGANSPKSCWQRKYLEKNKSKIYLIQIIMITLVLIHPIQAATNEIAEW